jgi:rRNA biogenesis protein RRP5
MKEFEIKKIALDIEKLYINNSISSFVWIRNISFMLHSKNLKASRDLAEKAINTISCNEENEKLNIWIAYLNLEALYGEPTQEEAFGRLFQRALRELNHKKLYLGAIAICERTGMMELCRLLLETSRRNFRSSLKIWFLSLAHLKKNDKYDLYKKNLESSLCDLPPRKHVKILVKLSLNEFKSGTFNRGRAIFEGTIRNFPTRSDLWSAYVDQEISQADQRKIRILFERAIASSMPPNKIKHLYKRYLKYEEKYGTIKNVENIKKKAFEFVKSFTMN